LDYVNKKRYKILKMKTVMVKQQGFGTVGAVAILEALSGQVSATPDQLRITPASKIVSMNIPGTAFGPGGKIQYIQENGGEAKFFEYSVHILAYTMIVLLKLIPVAVPAVAGV
jgi:hypothetical protein